MFTSSIIAILDNSKGHNPVLHRWIRLVCKRNRVFINIYLLSKFGGDKIKTEDFIAFTSCIIEIFTISRAIIQSSMAGSGWFAKGTKLS